MGDVSCRGFSLLLLFFWLLLLGMAGHRCWWWLEELRIKGDAQQAVAPASDWKGAGTTPQEGRQRRLGMQGNFFFYISARFTGHWERNWTTGNFCNVGFFFCYLKTNREWWGESDCSLRTSMAGLCGLSRRCFSQSLLVITYSCCRLFRWLNWFAPIEVMVLPCSSLEMQQVIIIMCNQLAVSGGWGGNSRKAIDIWNAKSF